MININATSEGKLHVGEYWPRKEGKQVHAYVIRTEDMDKVCCGK